MNKLIKKKPKVLIHYVMPGATGGPNILFSRIEESPLLKEKFDFIPLNQTRVAGGRLNLSLILELRKKISDVKPDIIHISGMQSAGLHCMIAAVLAGCKNRLITTHGFSGDALGIPYTKKVIFNAVIEPLTLVLAKHVHCISEYTYNKNMVIRYAKNKKTCIYNFPPRESIMNSADEIRSELGIAREEVIFVSASRIVLDKGYKQLVQAIKETKSLRNIRFIIVGDGAFERELKMLLFEEIEAKRVIMLGKRQDVLKILHGSDVFVLPTLHENLGNVFLEASFIGIPSIGTNVGGVTEIIEDNVTGILVPPYNTKLLVSAIIKLYEHSDLRKMMGQKAKERLHRYFATKKIEVEFHRLYSSLIDDCF